MQPIRNCIEIKKKKKNQVVQHEVFHLSSYYETTNPGNCKTTYLNIKSLQAQTP